MLDNIMKSNLFVSNNFFLKIVNVSYIISKNNEENTEVIKLQSMLRGHDIWNQINIWKESI